MLAFRLDDDGDLVATPDTGRPQFDRVRVPGADYMLERVLVRHELRRDMRTPDPSRGWTVALFNAAALAPDPREDPWTLSEKRVAIYAPAGTTFPPELMARIERAMETGFAVPIAVKP